MKNTTRRFNQSKIGRSIRRSQVQLFAFFGVAVCVLITPGWVVAQQASSQSGGQEAESTPSIQELQKNYDTAIEDVRTALKVIKRTGADYYSNKSTVAFEYREKWEEEAVIAEAAYARLRDAAFNLFFALPNPSPDLNKVIRIMNQKLLDKGQLTTCYRATKKLLEFTPDDPELVKLMGRVSIMSNDFDTALEFYQIQGSEAESFPMPERALYDFVESLGRKFQRELEMREADAQGEDLPHAILETTKGTIVIELFENQAPETVGNFVNLVQTGFYDGIIFHRVLRNILAETGTMTMIRPQPIGYTIYDESKKEDARHHFRGSVTTVLNNNEENSGAAGFTIMLVPGPNMDNRNTVFGRVISGLEVLDSIQESFKITEEGKEEFVQGITPDTIKSITVKRLRNHEYQPNRVKK